MLQPACWGDRSPLRQAAALLHYHPSLMTVRVAGNDSTYFHRRTEAETVLSISFNAKNTFTREIHEPYLVLH